MKDVIEPEQEINLEAEVFRSFMEEKKQRIFNGTCWDEDDDEEEMPQEKKSKKNEKEEE